MGLSIDHIKLFNFRSYADFELGGLGGLTVLVGPNAAGKTNVVEAVQLVTALNSFRHPTIDELVREGQSTASVRAQIGGDGRLLEVEMAIDEGRRRWLLNGKGKHAADLKGLLPSVVFTPDDLELAKGSMGKRRNALDELGAQLSKNHYLIKKDYEKVLQHKNRLLKDEADPALIDSVGDLIVTCGSQLCAYRSALFLRIAPKMEECYEEISGGRERLQACYVPSWEDDDPAVPASFSFGKQEARESLARALEERRSGERERRRCLVGPQLDKIDFFLDGRNVTSYASQGQQRSVVLAFKLAEAAVVRDVLGQKPVMLLDDVMSELDSSRRRALVDFMSSGVQTIVTSTNLSYFDRDMLKEAQVVELPRKDAEEDDPA